MIKVDNLSFSFPQKDLYDKISFTIEEGQHCAFIGTSGSGKSTLLEIMMDSDKHMYDGVLEVGSQRKIGFVSQFSQVDKGSDVTAFEFIAEEFIRLQEKITAICTEMETSSDIDALLDEYQEILDAFNAIGGESYESNISSQLNLAGLVKQRDLKVSALSGGEFKLIQVIKEMLVQPDLMIMDEPDVFLDFEHLNALRKLINGHKGTLFIVTHNRYLLDHCFNKIVHLEGMEVREFDGRYIEYNFSLLQHKIEVQELAIADDVEIARNAEVIDRFRIRSSYDAEAARGKSLKARVKIQERLLERRTNAPFVDIKQPQINFSSDKYLEEAMALKVDDYSVAFDEPLLENVAFEIKSTDKVALIGPNGTGKTTLMRDIYHGKSQAVKINEDIDMAYLSQIQGEILDESNTVMNEFIEAGFQTYTEVEDYLADYGFDSKGVQQKIGSLSGGEKNILQLAKIACTNANMLLLDEPTSHLDTYAQIALEKAVEDYKGAILMISHDYYSIVNCMDYVLLIEDKGIRKMTMKKFRRMIYASHFDRDYLIIEQKKKAVETKIAFALQDNNFELATKLSLELEGLIKLM